MCALTQIMLTLKNDGTVKNLIYTSEVKTK